MTPDDRLEREAERPLEPGQRRNVFGEVVCSDCGYHPPQHAETCYQPWGEAEKREAFGR